jgi:hypothetical protein
MAAWPSTPGDELIRLFRGQWLSRAIYVAAELGMADLLADGPRSVADLAAATNSQAPTLYRVIRLLASEGVFAEADDGRFELTPRAAALRQGVGVRACRCCTWAAQRPGRRPGTCRIQSEPVRRHSSMCTAWISSNTTGCTLRIRSCSTS